LEIHFQSHHAEISDNMRRKAERLVTKAAERIPRAVEAVVRFEQDGPTRRVSVVMKTPSTHDLVGKAEGRFYGPALVSAIARVLAQSSKERMVLPKDRAHRLARARA
jgi:ribosome-associated translation inhibitor RaiA